MGRYGTGCDACEGGAAGQPLSRSRRAWASNLAWALLALSAAACGQPADGDGGGNQGGVGGDGSTCGTGTAGNLGVDLKAQLEVNAQDKALGTGGVVILSSGALKEGEELDTVFVLRNVWETGSARELRIEKLELLYSKPEAAVDAEAPYSCSVEIDGTEVPCAGASVLSLVPDGAPASFCTSGKRASQGRVHVRFRKQADNVVRQAFLRVHAPADERFGAAPFQAQLTTKAGTPKLKLSPEIIDFGVVKLGACEEKKLSLLNSGDADVLVETIELAKTLPKPILATIEGKEHKGGDTVTFAPPLVVPPQQSVPVLVKYCPTGPEPFLDVVKVYSNDAGSPQTAKLSANQQVPCLKVIPQAAVNFGFVPLATVSTRKVRLESCGSAPVEVSTLALQDDKELVFGVDTSKIAALGGKAVSKDNVISIGQNQAVEVEVRCTPEGEYSDPATGKPAPYTAKLAIEDNTIAANKTLDLSCWGTATNCPTAIADVIPGEEIAPQTPVQLIGSKSFAGPNQKIVKYAWKVVKQPKGSEADHIFWPNANIADPKFGAKTAIKDFSGAEVESIQVNIAGEYLFELEVTDDAGIKGCQVAQVLLVVVPDEAIHVELLWQTPGDTDKLDKGLGAGADLDLHFTHSNALAAKICQDPLEMCGGQPCFCLADLDKDGKVDPFFHSLYDTFWFNPAPNWGSTDTSVDDNPQLDLDDTDGWGPENLNLKNAENNTTYTVGVHFWDAHGYGDSVATVRIYIQGVLKGEYESQELTQCDMWWVRQIAWPSGELLEIGGSSGKLTKKYFPKFAKALGAKCAQ